MNFLENILQFEDLQFAVSMELSTKQLNVVWKISLSKFAFTYLFALLILCDNGVVLLNDS